MVEIKLDIVSFKVALILAAAWAVGELTYSKAVRPLLVPTGLLID